MTGAELRKKRLAVGLSQEALARALSVSVSSVSKWESGARRIRPFAVHAIETVLTQLERHKLASQQHRLADLKQLRHRKGGEPAASPERLDCRRSTTPQYIRANPGRFLPASVPSTRRSSRKAISCE